MYERRLYQLMDFLAESSVSLSQESFKDIFHDSYTSLWDKFTRCHGDLLKFWLQLDTKNKCKLSYYLQKESTHELV